MKSKHSHWFNPTDNAMWDEYYEKFWFIVMPMFGLFVAVLVFAVIKGSQ